MSSCKSYPPRRPAKWRIISALLFPLVGVFVFLVFNPINVAVAQGPQVDLRTFVTAPHFHGLPYVEAHAYGSQAIPELAAMLKDPSMEPHWAKVVATLGCIEDASAVQPLIEFLKRYQSPVSADAFRALLSVLPALGQIAYGGDAVALKLITAFVDFVAY